MNAPKVKDKAKAKDIGNIGNIGEDDRSGKCLAWAGMDGGKCDLVRRSLLQAGAAVLLCGGMSSRVGAVLPSKNAKTGLFSDPRSTQHWIAIDHPESPYRHQKIMAKLEQDGLLQSAVQMSPLALEAAERQLPLIHSDSHIAAIRKNSGHGAAAVAVALALGAVQAVMEGRVQNAFCVTRPPGHHALNTGREEGFCYYSTIAIAARYAQRQYGLERILIVDWDYHHGNGTEAAFYEDPSVLFFSTHDANAYPGTGDPARKGQGRGLGYNINVHLDCGANDSDIIAAFEQRLVPAADSFAPELVLLSAGFDSRRDDLLGCFDVSDQGFAELTAIVAGIADRHCQGRLVSMLEGGYTLSGLASASATHLKSLLAAAPVAT